MLCVCVCGCEMCWLGSNVACLLTKHYKPLCFVARRAACVIFLSCSLVPIDSTPGLIYVSFHPSQDDTRAHKTCVMHPMKIEIYFILRHRVSIHRTQISLALFVTTCAMIFFSHITPRNPYANRATLCVIGITQRPPGCDALSALSLYICANKCARLVLRSIKHSGNQSVH